MTLRLLVLSLVCASTPAKITDRPIAFDDVRKKLTVEYRRAHQSSPAAGVEISPKVIVIHHTGMATLDAAWRYFNRTKIEAGRKKVAKASQLNVSAHFLVDRDGSIYQLMPTNWMARHCIGLNHVAIGIENVGGIPGHPLTHAQVRANADLVRHLKRLHEITHVIGHHEYRLFERHAYFDERDPKYRTAKIDPGAKFMKRLRKQIRDLGLAGAPKQ